MNTMMAIPTSLNITITTLINITFITQHLLKRNTKSWLSGIKNNFKLRQLGILLETAAKSADPNQTSKES